MLMEIVSIRQDCRWEPALLASAASKLNEGVPCLRLRKHAHDKREAWHPAFGRGASKPLAIVDGTLRARTKH